MTKSGVSRIVCQKLILRKKDSQRRLPVSLLERPPILLLHAKTLRRGKIYRGTFPMEIFLLQIFNQLFIEIVY